MKGLSKKLMITKILLALLSFSGILIVLIVKTVNNNFSIEIQLLSYTIYEQNFQQKFQFLQKIRIAINSSIVIALIFESLLAFNSFYEYFKIKPKSIEIYVNRKMFKAEYCVTSTSVLFYINLSAYSISFQKQSAKCNCDIVENDMLQLIISSIILLIKLLILSTNLYLSYKYHLENQISNKQSKITQEQRQLNKYFEKDTKQMYQTLLRKQNKKTFLEIKDFKGFQLGRNFTQFQKNFQTRPQNQFQRNKIQGDKNQGNKIQGDKTQGNKIGRDKTQGDKIQGDTIQKDKENKIKRNKGQIIQNSQSIFDVENLYLQSFKNFEKIQQQNQLSETFQKRFQVDSAQNDSIYDRQKVKEVFQESVKKLQRLGYEVQQYPYQQKIYAMRTFSIPKSPKRRFPKRQHTQNFQGNQKSKSNQNKDLSDPTQSENKQQINIVIRFQTSQKRGNQQIYKEDDLQAIELDKIFYRQYIEKQKIQKEQKQKQLLLSMNKNQLSQVMNERQRSKCSYQKLVEQDHDLYKIKQQMRQYQSRSDAVQNGYCYEELALHMPQNKVAKYEELDQMNRMLCDQIRYPESGKNIRGSQHKYAHIREKKKPIQLIRGKGA